MAERADGKKRISFLCRPELLPYIQDAQQALDRTQSNQINYFLEVALGLKEDDYDYRYFKVWLAKYKGGMDHQTETWMRKELACLKNDIVELRKECE